MFSLFGFLGQHTYAKLSAPRDAAKDAKPAFWRRMSEKSWSPVTVLSNEEYVEMLKEKMLKVDVEVSILDDKIAALRKEQERLDEQTSRATSSTE